MYFSKNYYSKDYIVIYIKEEILQPKNFNRLNLQ